MEHLPLNWSIYPQTVEQKSAEVELFIRSIHPKVTFKPMYEVYLQNPNISKEELRTFLDDNGFNPAGMSRISIRLFMEKPDIEPDEELYDLVYSDIESMEGIPEGRYTIILNDNYIDRTSAIGEKDNTINKTKPNRIEKE